MQTWRGTKGDPNGKNTIADNGGMAADEADELVEDLQASPERHAAPEGILEDLDPDDLFEGADDNYNRNPRKRRALVPRTS